MNAEIALAMYERERVRKARWYQKRAAREPAWLQARAERAVQYRLEIKLGQRRPKSQREVIEKALQNRLHPNSYPD